jgi:hypothetical protein
MRGGYPASALVPGRAVLRAVLETGPTPAPFLLPDARSMHQLKMPLWQSAAGHQTEKTDGLPNVLCFMKNEKQDIAVRSFFLEGKEAQIKI